MTAPAIRIDRRRVFRDETSARGEALALVPTALGLDFDAPGAVATEVDEAGTIAVVSVMGPLEHHASWLWQSYDEVRAAVEAALADEAVKAVVLRLDSPGGVVAGMNETHDAIRAAKERHGKPLIAYVDEVACSAAYILAAACDEVWMPPTAQVGSIGVIAKIVSAKRLLDKAGIDVALVTSGKRKADGAESREITADVLAVAQEKVDFLAARFFDAVAEARGLSPKAVRKLEAAVFHGPQAVEVGLADVVAGWDDLMVTLAMITDESDA